MGRHLSFSVDKTNLLRCTSSLFWSLLPFLPSPRHPGMPDSRLLKIPLCTATPWTSSPVLEKSSLHLKTATTLDQLMISSNVLRKSLVQVLTVSAVFVKLSESANLLHILKNIL